MQHRRCPHGENPGLGARRGLHMRAVADGEECIIIHDTQVCPNTDEPLMKRQSSLREPAMRHRPRRAHTKRGWDRRATRQDHLPIGDARDRGIKRKGHPQFRHLPPHHGRGPGRHAREVWPMFHHRHGRLHTRLTQRKSHRHGKLTARHTATDHRHLGRLLSCFDRRQKITPARGIDIKRLGPDRVFGKPRQVHLGRDPYVD